MQVAATRGAGHIRHDVPDYLESGPHFSALFVLAGSRGVDPEALRKRLGLSESDFHALLHRLQMGYLIDVVSERRGGEIVERLHLTEEGASALQRTLERMCELPELE